MNIYEEVTRLLAESRDMDIKKLTPTTEFSSLGIDSLDMMDLVMQVEDVFNVNIELNPEIKTVNDLCLLIESLKKAK